MFHAQLRQFPNTTTAFNLNEEALRSRILVPWLAGKPVHWGDRSWDPGRARLTIYEGPELRVEQMGMGRGWANVTRSGRDVTEQLLAQAHAAVQPPPASSSPLESLKQAILERCVAEEALPLPAVVELAAGSGLGARASERLALAEQAAWELLHRGQLILWRDGVPLGREEWQPTLLSWAAWTGARSVALAAAP
jgi:hypothetical protein